MRKRSHLFSTLVVIAGLGLGACASEVDGDPVLELRSKDAIPCTLPKGEACPDKLSCIDAIDSCDPKFGDLDCPGVCVDVEEACDLDNPAKIYVGESPQVCAVIKFTCAPGSVMFFDACGCGCEVLEGTPL